MTEPSNKPCQAPDKGDLSILYQRAREEWDERLGSVVKQAHLWKLMCFFSMLITTMAVGGVIYIGSQSKIEPYVVGVKNGEEVIGVAQIKKLPDSQFEALKVIEVEDFIINVRAVLMDVEAEKSAIQKAYARMQPNSPAYTQITNRFKEQNPFERAQTQLVKVEINSVLPISDHSYQAEWVETISDRQGGIIDTVNYKATLNTQTIQPKTKQDMYSNPLGFFVVTFNDVQIK